MHRDRVLTASLGGRFEVRRSRRRDEEEGVGASQPPREEGARSVVVGRRILARAREELGYRRVPRLRNVDRLERCDHVVATKAGLYLTTPHESWLLCRGSFYGLTRLGADLLCFQAFPRAGRGRVLRISPAGTVETLIRSLPWGCHQIDQRDGRVYVTDTHRNAVRVYAPGTYALEGEFHPLGELDRGRSSANYAHFNSILVEGERIHLLCHNDTMKGGRRSEILVCDRRFRVLEKIPTPFGSAHNLVLLDGEYVSCDSQHSAVASLARKLHVFENFTRGLSVTDRHVVVGESAYGERSLRARMAGWVSYFDRDWNPVGRLELPGMVQEIRALHEPDWGLSEDLARIRRRPARVPARGPAPGAASG